MSEVPNRTIYVVSDSTGETAEKVVRAALVQFPEHRVSIRVFTRIRTREAADEIMVKAAEQGAMVVFTLVSPDLREYLYEAALRNHVELVDVIGTLIAKVGVFIEAAPLNMPFSSMPLSEEYFRRVEAMEFTIRSDDGKEPHNLRKADIILTGVSRTSKTPLSAYLAGRGLRVANVPLTLGVPPPPELEEVNPDRVVGLTIDLAQLVEIRKARLKHLGMDAETNYGLPDHIREELEYAHNFFAEHPQWLVVDVSGKAIEETATIILESIRERRGTLRPPRTG